MAGQYNFTIKQNTDFTRSIVWQDSTGSPVDLTGKHARLVARARKEDQTPVIDISDQDNISLSADGTITIAFNETATAAMDFRYARYDLFLDDTFLLSGEITIARSTLHG